MTAPCERADCPMMIEHETLPRRIWVISALLLTLLLGIAVLLGKEASLREKSTLERIKALQTLQAEVATLKAKDAEHDRNIRQLLQASGLPVPEKLAHAK